MKIKEILIYIGIIILILVGGYLKKDQINIIEGNVGNTGGTLIKKNISLEGCEKKCNNSCTCKQYLWKKGNPQTEKHECILSTELITDANPDYKDYDPYVRPDRLAVEFPQYKETIRGSYPKGVAEMKCREKGLVLSTPQEVKQAGDGSENLGEGWTTDGIKNIRNSVPINVDKSKSNAHCSTNPEFSCNPIYPWKDHHWRDYRRPAWKNHITIDWKGNLNNPNVATKGYAQTKDLCKYKCWKRWGDQCKLIEWDSRSKICRTSKLNLPLRPNRYKCSWTVAKTEKKPGLKSK